MVYQAPYIDESGLHIASYAEIRDSLIDEMKAIYGSDIYLDNDSQDYQMVSAFALMAYDVQQGLLLAYNNISPTTATGAGLDRVVALNGIRRAKASYAQCIVTLAGTAGTVINNGLIEDSHGLQWALPPTVTLDEKGLATAEVTCTTVGSVTAAPGELTTIVTPTKGWLSVDNAQWATPGAAEESDGALRAKQKISTANPSKTVFEGTIGAVANTKGVVRYAAYENDTDLIKDGLPPHSITLVVEGGDDTAIAQGIYRHKTPGCYTNGDIAIEIPGQQQPIRFFRPHYLDLAVQVLIHPLKGYTDAINSRIKQNIYDYINGLAIGESLYIPNLNGPILAAFNGQPSFYVTALKAQLKTEQDETSVEGEQGEAHKITMNAIQAARIRLEDIQIEVSQ